MVAISALVVFQLCLCPSPTGQLQEPPVRFELGAETTDVRPGGTLLLTLKADIPRGWHLYGMRQAADGPLPTRVAVGPEGTFALASPVTADPPKTEFDPNFGLPVEWYDDAATFRVPVRASPTALPGIYRVQVLVSYQRCNNRICLPLTTDTLQVPVTVGGSSAARPPSAQAVRLPAPR